MTEHDIDKSIVSNIEIPDEMRDSLINDVKKGKRTSDIRFRYSNVIMALCMAIISFASGVTANAAFVSYRNRVENMPQEEQADYNDKLANDTYDVGDESMTRSFTKTEVERLVKLEVDYYKNGVFPQESMPFLKNLSELKEGMIAFVEEDNKLHIPDGELSDEQLLQYIDYEAKYIYTIEQEAEKTEASDDAENNEAEEDAYDRITVDVSSEDEAIIKEESRKLIYQFYGEEVDDTWNCEIRGANLSELSTFGEEWDGYSVNWSESDAPNAKFYELQLPKNEDGILILSRGGRSVYADCEEYSWEEAQEYKDQGEKTVKEFVKAKFGLGEPDRIEYGGFEAADGAPVESSVMFFELYYGDNHISVDWIISKDEVNGIVGTGISK